MKAATVILSLILLTGTGIYLLPPAKVPRVANDTKACLANRNMDDPPQIWIDGGRFIMGSTDYYPEESPPIEVDVKGFWIDQHEVTNAQFATFVGETDYITRAEQKPDPGLFPDIPEHLLVSGSVVFIMPADLQNGGNMTQWWQFVPGANWREPFGPGSNISGKQNHPVVHIAYEDALAYARWKDRELPTEAQWEYAAHGGLEQQPYGLDTELNSNETWQANIWQGAFPLSNTGEDGYIGTSPVGCYQPNQYGVYDTTGNVWEWVSDWYYPTHDAIEIAFSPNASGFDPRQPGVPVRVIKGGSYLCAKNYCIRYRPAARQPQESTLSAAHIGFRTISNER